MISCGATEVNLSVVLKQEDVKYALTRLHAEFFENRNMHVEGDLAQESSFN